MENNGENSTPHSTNHLLRSHNKEDLQKMHSSQLDFRLGDEKKAEEKICESQVSVGTQLKEKKKNWYYHIMNFGQNLTHEE